MKKTLLSLALIAGLGLAANAQTTPLKFGVKAGVAFANMTVSSSGTSASFQSNTSFYVGGTVDVPLNEMFAVQPGLTLIGKGAKTTDTDDGVYTQKISNMYLEIPVNFVASFEAGPGKVFVGAGPYYAFALSGQLKETEDGNTVKTDVNFGSDATDDFKSGDFGLNFLAGYQLTSGFNVHAGYGLGLSNISPESQGFKTKNKVFSVGVGFSF